MERIVDRVGRCDCGLAVIHVTYELSPREVQMHTQAPRGNKTGVWVHITPQGVQVSPPRGWRCTISDIVIIALSVEDEVDGEDEVVEDEPVGEGDGTEESNDE